MIDYNFAVTLIIKMEGGDVVVDHPKDPGGVTKYGISLKAYPHLGRDGIINLTLAQAKEIYKRDYWDKCECDKLPPIVALLVFDCAVNQGAGRAVRLLYKALRLPEAPTPTPALLTAVRGRSDVALITEFTARRAVHYGLLKTFTTFGLGWMRRLIYMFGVAVASKED